MNAPDILNNSGICTFDEFQIRMNIFITGLPYANVFENINLEKNNIAVVGSIITACLQKRHVLVNLFNKTSKLESETKEHSVLRRYFSEYYSKSDIDIMISNSSHFNFCKKARLLFNDLLLNFCNYYSDAEPQFFKLKPIKIIGFFVNKKFVIQLIKDNNISYGSNEEETFKYISDNISKPEISLYFKNFISTQYDNYIFNEFDIFSNEEKQYCKHFIPELYLQYSQLNDNDINVEYNIKIVNKIYDDDDNNFSLHIQTKYRINSPFLNHPFEIFRNKSVDPFALIHKFHLNCVRGYYNGKNVYLLPSCISAHLTYWNMDVKYFSGKQSPYEIINKYRMRGFGTFLNKKEIKEISIYSKNNIFWQNIYKITTNIPTCTLYLKSLLFQPRLINADFYINDPIHITNTELYNIGLHHKYRKCNKKNLKSILNNAEYNYNIVDFDGNIIPINISIINSIIYIQELDEKEIKNE